MQIEKISQKCYKNVTRFIRILQILIVLRYSYYKQFSKQCLINIMYNFHLRKFLENYFHTNQSFINVRRQIFQSFFGLLNYRVVITFHLIIQNRLSVITVKMKKKFLYNLFLQISSENEWPSNSLAVSVCLTTDSLFPLAPPRSRIFQLTVHLFVL